MSIYDRDQSGWLWLTRAHDHIWADRLLPLEHRIEVCRLLHELALRCDPIGGEEPAPPPLPVPYCPMSYGTCGGTRR